MSHSQSDAFMSHGVIAIGESRYCLRQGSVMALPSSDFLTWQNLSVTLVFKDA